MTRSESSLTIEWTLPDLEEEKWEFFHHPAKQVFYEKHGITWDSITASAPSAGLARYPRSSEIEGVPVLLSHHTFEDYCRYLAKAKRGYRLNYSKMEDALQLEGRLTLPAPIILQSGGEALLFSGYRRLCLAWNYGMIPYVLRVHL